MLRPAIVHTRNLSTLEMQFVAAVLPGVKHVHGEHGRDVGDLVRPADDVRLATQGLAQGFGQAQPRGFGERPAAVDEIDRLEAPGRDGLQDRLQGYFSGSRAAEAVIAASENSPESSAGPQTGTSRTPSSSAERRSSSKLRSTEFHDPQREQESLQSA